MTHRKDPVSIGAGRGAVVVSVVAMLTELEGCERCWQHAGTEEALRVSYGGSLVSRKTQGHDGAQGGVDKDEGEEKQGEAASPGPRPRGCSGLGEPRPALPSF